LRRVVDIRRVGADALDRGRLTASGQVVHAGLSACGEIGGETDLSRGHGSSSHRRRRRRVVSVIDAHVEFGVPRVVEFRAL
jgi:hypothetical protein